MKCSSCRGKGTLFGRTCETCKGTGKKPKPDPCAEAVARARREERIAALAILEELDVCLARARIRLRS